jgi:hypothetical protein
MNGSLLSKVKSTIMTLAAVFFVLVGAYTWVDALPGGPWKKRRREKTTNGFKAQWM